MSDNIWTNPLVLKVNGGTPRSDENLCATCRNCHVSRGASTGRTTYRCYANYQHPVNLTEGMAQCSHYLDTRRPTLEQMQEIAWSLMTDKGGRKIGFLSPEELRARGRDNYPSTPGFGR